MAKRKPTQAPLPWRGRDPKDGHDASKEKNAKKLMLMLIANSVLVISVYFILNSLEFWPIFFIYMGIAAVLVVIYALYNRGFVYRNVTPDMLPDTMSYEQKTAVLDEAKQRMDKSRWMLTLILPFLVAFMLDALYLFVLSDLFTTLGITF